jgi:hypothetical protein
MTRPPSLSSHVHIPDGILFHMLEDEVVLLNLSTGVYFGLNRVGTRIWQLLNAEPSQSLREIANVLVGEYGTTKHRCTKELLALVALLEEKELLEVVH